MKIAAARNHHPGEMPPARPDAQNAPPAPAPKKTLAMLTAFGRTPNPVSHRAETFAHLAPRLFIGRRAGSDGLLDSMRRPVYAVLRLKTRNSKPVLSYNCPGLKGDQLTPEEQKRITKIENLLETLTETQVEQQNQIVKLHESQRALHESQKGLQESQKKTDEQVKTMAGSVQTLTTIVGRLADVQERTETRLTALIETVDRVVERLDRDGRR